MITRPRRPIPDDFYADLANAYNEVTATGNHQPARVISKITGVPLSTIHRWIYTARQRGLLPPTTPGKATGITPTCSKCGRPL